MVAATEIETPAHAELGIDVAGLVAETMPGWEQSYIRALLAGSPGERDLGAIQAELLFYPGQYLLHYMEEGADRWKVLTPATLAAAFGGQPVDSGWLSPNVVRCGEGTQGPFAVMWVPPALHTVQVVEDISSDEDDAPHQADAEEGAEAAPVPVPAVVKERKLSTWQVPLPGLVFAGVGRSYYVFAVTSRTFSPQAGLYAAPLPNVHNNGAICWGAGNQPPQASGAGIRDAWQLFLDAPFNDHLVGGKSAAYPNDVRAHLYTLHQVGAPEYPERDLVGYRQSPSVERVIKQYILK